MDKKNLPWIIGLLALAIAFFFWGRSRGREEGKVEIANNIAIVKEIAEMSALSVTGHSTVKVSNKEAESSMYGQLKNAFTENTLNVTIPYEAKFGVDLKTQDIRMDAESKKVTIYLPEVKLLSMQLKLDSVDAITKTGLLATSTIDQYVKVQRKLYNETKKSLENNTQYYRMAENHITAIMQRYYGPLGYTVETVFGKSSGIKLR